MGQQPLVRLVKEGTLVTRSAQSQSLAELLTHTIQWSQCSYLLCYRYPYLQLLYHFINRSFRLNTVKEN